MLRTRPLAILSASAFALALAGCGGKSEDKKPDAPATVGVVTLQPQATTLTTELPGRTSAFQIAEVRPQVTGIIRQRLFTEGGDVKAGNPLYRIDPATYQAALDSARGNLASAEANADRARQKAARYAELVAIKAVSPQDNDDAQAAKRQADAAVSVARAAVTTARINVDYTAVKAPISGRIGKSAVTAGALVSANQADNLTTIQQLDPIYVDIAQSTSELFRLRQALSRGDIHRDAGGRVAVTLLLEDGSTYARTGTLQFSDVTVDPATSTVTLRALFPNPDHDLLPGLFVRARLAEGSKPDALLVPMRGVTRNPQGEATALVAGAGDVVESRVVQVGRAVGDQWEVLGGLKAGDRVIVDGLQKLKPGATVKPVSATQAGAATASAPAAATAAKTTTGG